MCALPGTTPLHARAVSRAQILVTLSCAASRSWIEAITPAMVEVQVGETFA